VKRLPLRVWILLVFLLALVIYFPTVKYDFVLDDNFLITGNEQLTTPSGTLGYFSRGVWDGIESTGQMKPRSNIYRPLLMVGYALDRAIFGLNPGWYHFINILMHAVVCALVMTFIYQLLGFWQQLMPNRIEIALVSGILFAVHPIHIEAVSWISGRAEVLAGLFLMSSLCCYLRYHQKGILRWLLFSMMFFSFALMSKESAIAGILFIFLIELSINSWRFPYVFRGRINDLPSHKAGEDKSKKIDKSTVGLVSIAIVTVVYLLIRIAVFGRLGPVPEGQFFFGETVLTRFFTMSEVFVDYFRKLLIPWPLFIVYGDYTPIPIARTLTPQVLGSIAITIAIPVIAIWARKWVSSVAFAIGWLYLALLPVSQIMPFGALMGERFLYIPSVGYCFLLALLLAHVFNIRIRRYVQVGLVSTYLIMTFVHNPVWASERTLWDYSVTIHPDDHIAHYNRGVCMVKDKEYSNAILEFETALQLKPTMASAHTNLGVEYQRIGQIEKAFDCYRKALMLDPLLPETHYNLGNLYLEMGQIHKAIQEYRETIRIQPKFVQARTNLAYVYYSEGNFSIAEKILKSVLNDNPRLIEAYNILGAVYIKQRKLDKGLDQFNRILEIDPGNYQAYTNKQMVLEALSKE